MTNLISVQTAQKLRNGSLPHIAPNASPINTSVPLSLAAPMDSAPEAVLTDSRRGITWRVALTRTPSSEGGASWVASILLPPQPTVVRYHFVLANGQKIQEHRQIEGTHPVLYGEWRDMDFRICVYDPAGMPPQWVRGLVMYQIFPDRFATSDPNNLHKKHETVQGQEPIYNQWGDAPEHPPQGRDFFGGNLRGVIQKLDYLHDLGVSCIYFTPIFESPSNHRYDALDYFKIDARLGDENDLRELVREADARDMRVMLDGVWNHCSDESAMFKAAQADKTSVWYRRFKFAEWPKYDGWLNVKAMPEFSEAPETEDFFFGPNGVAQYWLQTGIAGWRTDVTPWKSEAFWRRHFAALRGAKPDCYIIAEDWGDCTTRFTGDQYDATMNYRFAYSVIGFINDKICASELDDRLEMLRRDTPEPIWHSQMNLLTSHDTGRLLTFFNNDKAKVMLATGLQLGYPGVPMIYYGEEAGCEGTYAEGGRVSMPWGNIDAELHAFFKAAVHARRNSSALSFGNAQTVWLDDATKTYGFAREHEGEVVYVLINNGSTATQIDMAVADGNYVDLLNKVATLPAHNGILSIVLPAGSVAWLTHQTQ